MSVETLFPLSRIPAVNVSNVPQISNEYRLEALHWEAQPLEDSSDKLFAAKTVKRKESEKALRAKIQPLQGGIP